MKIIGVTEGGYLVEATGSELADAAGYRSQRDVPGSVISDSSYRHVRLPIGLEILPSVTHRFLWELRQHEEKVRESEGMLRALADMLRNALPTTVIAPESPVAVAPQS